MWEAAYDDYNFSLEGEETLEVQKLSLGFCFSGHDVRRQSVSTAVSIQIWTEKKKLGYILKLPRLCV